MVIPLLFTSFTLFCIYVGLFGTRITNLATSPLSKGIEKYEQAQIHSIAILG